MNMYYQVVLLCIIRVKLHFKFVYTGHSVGYGITILHVCSMLANLRVFRKPVPASLQRKFLSPLLVYFSAVDRAVCNLLPPDKNTSDAVDVRQELDLRIGEQRTCTCTRHLSIGEPHV